MAKIQKERMFEIIVDSGANVYKTRCLAKHIQDLKSTCSEAGEIVKITDVTENYPINSMAVFDALKAAQFGDAECNAIMMLIDKYYANAYSF
jgi:hypothetical protein